MGEFPLHRVFSRLMLLGMIGGTTWLVIHRYRDRARAGIQSSIAAVPAALAAGPACRLRSDGIAVTPLMLLEVRVWNGRVPADSLTWLALALKGLGSGLAVALLEETFFRGAMQGALQRAGATRWALFAVPVLYSACTFSGDQPPLLAAEVNTLSGFSVWRDFFSSFAQPLRILDALVALYFVGLLLALVRQRWEISPAASGCMRASWP